MVKFKFDCSKVEKEKQRALRVAAGCVLERLLDEQYIPHETGLLERNTRVDDGEIRRNHVKIVSDEAYAVFVYHRPDVVFTRDVNSKARAFWFEPFLRGRLTGVIVNGFAEALQRMNREV